MHKKTGIILMIFFLAAAGCFSTWKQYHSQPPGFIRLHVLANSNLFYDQDLKHKVKNRIISETAESFHRATSLPQAMSIAVSELTRIEEIARREIQRQGFSYPVRVEIGTYRFPVKSYLTRDGEGLSRFALPPGRYQAVRVIIGEGKGSNWWCVLYPPLCFVDASRVIPPASAQHAAAPVGPGKTSIKKKDNKKQPRIEYRLRIIEIWRKIVR